MSLLLVVSVSGGEDSTAIALVALELYGPRAYRFVFAGTGNALQATFDYALDYLPQVLGVTVDVVRAQFADEFATKRGNLIRIAAGESKRTVYGRRKFMYAWTPEVHRGTSVRILGATPFLSGRVSTAAAANVPLLRTWTSRPRAARSTAFASDI